ncbi:hypothetical protein SCOR_14215 [Sulfidibacter corallicola]|uniref:Uncharacterized protein n=1 Tax=Sulfidibacter corallicola TaxID=2818388 RepID=A0A8A4TBN3_SULCO|nr:hypothetical protein [Sulfidibacter corallicola]QTD47529.1 hypothetical protein J3U87_18195 [Sulfidibacter corallicola]
MQETKKVHIELAEVDRESTYNLGFFSVDFEDGSLLFQLHARVCGDPKCHCDNIQMDWLTQHQRKSTWYTGEREWHDEKHQPLPDEVAQVFKIAEGTEEFQQRYLHLVYLRRKMILVETGYDLEKPIMVPTELLLDGADPANGCLGEVVSHDKGKATRWQFMVDTCKDPECYCYNLFVNLKSKGGDERALLVDEKGRMRAAEGRRENKALLKLIKPKLQKDDRFKSMITFFQAHRRLENYARFVARYEAEHLPVV